TAPTSRRTLAPGDHLAWSTSRALLPSRAPSRSRPDERRRPPWSRSRDSREHRVSAADDPAPGRVPPGHPRQPGRKRSTTVAVSMRELLENGVHFGHQTRRWNPKMKRFIFTERNGIYIIDLRQTLDYIEKAYDYIRTTVAEGGHILFVGTKKQAQEAIAEQAMRVAQPYVNDRWLGGMLTNFQTVYKRLQRMKELEALGDLSGTAAGYTKKETLQLNREKIKLTKTLGGLRDMTKVPSAIWVVDTKKEHIAVDEARKLGIPVIAVLDTNCDP